MNKRFKDSLPKMATFGALLTGFGLSLGTSFAAHPPIELKTYDEVGERPNGITFRKASY